jgi:hypothetical protein
MPGRALAIGFGADSASALRLPSKGAKSRMTSGNRVAVLVSSLRLARAGGEDRRRSSRGRRHYQLSSPRRRRKA